MRDGHSLVTARHDADELAVITEYGVFCIFVVRAFLGDDIFPVCIGIAVQHSECIWGEREKENR